MRRANVACVFLGVCIATIVVGGEQRGVAPPGTGVIAGVVTAADSGRPERRATVTLTNVATNAVAGRAVTDQSGAFAFTAVPEAQYLLKAQHAGFLEVIYGQKQAGSGRPGTPIPLAAGQKIDNLALRLPRGGVISGVLTDESGDPMFGVAVRAMRVLLVNGEVQLSGSGGGYANTDDRGSYRIAMLQPGQYIVSADPQDELVTAVNSTAAILERSRDVIASRAASGSMSAADIAALTARTNASIGPVLPMPKEAYKRVYYPGALQPTSASRVTVAVAEERAGVDMQLQLVPIASVSGLVSWNGGKLPTGNTASDTSITLSDRAGFPGSGTDRYAHASADGSFSFPTVPPGDYTLWAQASVTAPPAAGGAPIRQHLWATTDVTVNGQPISDIRLAFDTGLSVSGKVVIEGGAVEAARIRVRPEHVGYSLGELPLMEIPLGPDGRFTAAGLPPGKYRFVATTAAQGILPMRSAMFGARDSLDFGVTLTAGVPAPEGVITVIPRLAEISGQVQTEQLEPLSGYTVIAFSTEQRFWTPASRRIQAARPAADGRFSLKNLPGGEYKLVAVSDIDNGQWFDPAYLQTLLAHPLAISLTLAEGERRDQMLRVGR